MAEYLPNEFAEEKTVAIGAAATATKAAVAKREHRFVAAMVKGVEASGTFTVTVGDDIILDAAPVDAGQTVTFGPFKGIGAGGNKEIEITSTGLGVSGRVVLITFSHPAD